MQKKKSLTIRAFSWALETMLEQAPLYLKAALSIVAVVAVLLVSGMLLSAWIVQFTGSDSGAIFLALVIVLLCVTGVFFALGMQRISLDLAYHGHSTFGTLFSQRHLLMRGVGFVIMWWVLYGLGLLLLVLPGLYFFYRYYFTFTALVQQECTIQEAFALSAHMTKGRASDLVGFIILAILVTWIPIIGFIIADLAQAYMYRIIQEEGDAFHPERLVD